MKKNRVSHDVAHIWNTFGTNDFLEKSTEKWHDDAWSLNSFDMIEKPYLASELMLSLWIKNAHVRGASVIRRIKKT